MSLHIITGSDHAGFHTKQTILAKLQSDNAQLTDCGTYSEESTDYPDYAHDVARRVLEAGPDARGILVCGSGNGVCMAANKHAGIRAALCWTEELASLARQHNNANVLCIPARFVPEETALAMVKTFLETDFEGGRHERRAAKIDRGF